MAKFLDENGLSHFYSLLKSKFNMVDIEIDSIKDTFNVKYPMPVVDVGSKYQCKVSDSASSAQSGCVVGGSMYLFFADSSNSLRMVIINLTSGTSGEVALSFTGHANTATATGDGTILLSSNGTTSLYEISTSGTLLHTYTAPTSDCCIAYDQINSRYVGTSRTAGKFYYFDGSLSLVSSEDFDWSFITADDGPVAMQNCAFDSGVFYASFRPNSVYAVNVETLQFADMFRVAFSPSSEFEGMMFIDGSCYELCHSYTERITTVNPVFAGDYLPYNGYNGELTFINGSYIDSLWNTMTIYVDYSARSAICYGTQNYPFLSLTQAFERSFSYKNVIINVKGNPTSPVKLTIGDTSVSINAWDTSAKPTIPGMVVSGIGSLSLDNLLISVDSGVALEFSDKSNITAHISNCAITSTGGTGIAVNWGSSVEIRNSTTISATTAISGVNANVSVAPASIMSGAVNSYRNSHIGNKQEILHNNTADNFTTKIPITAFNVVVGQIKTKVNTYNFYIPYVGVIVGNSLYAFGSRYASVVGDAVTATVEGGLSNGGTTFTKSAGTANAVIYTMFGVY